MRHLHLLAAVFLVLLAPSLTADEVDRNLMTNPNYLLAEDFDRKLAEVEGIKLGDAVDKIDKERVKEENESGWFFYQNDARFKVKEGKVVEIGIPAETAMKAGLTTLGTIEKLLGKPDDIDELKYGERVILKTLIYNQKGLRVHWVALKGGRMAHVTVVAE